MAPVNDVHVAGGRTARVVVDRDAFGFCEAPRFHFSGPAARFFAFAREQAAAVEFEQVRAGRVEHLDPAVTLVHHIHIASRFIDGHAGWFFEFSSARAFLAEGLFEYVSAGGQRRNRGEGQAPNHGAQ